MIHSLIEQLEGRLFLSAVPAAIADVPVHAHAAATLVSAAATAIPRVVGTYSGWGWNSDGKVRFTVTITKQTSDGRIWGTISSRIIGRRAISIQGTIRSDGRFSVKSTTVGVSGTASGRVVGKTMTGVGRSPYGSASFKVIRP